MQLIPRPTRALVALFFLAPLPALPTHPAASPCFAFGIFCFQVAAAKASAYPGSHPYKKDPDLLTDARDLDAAWEVNFVASFLLFRPGPASAQTFAPPPYSLFFLALSQFSQAAARDLALGRSPRPPAGIPSKPELARSPAKAPRPPYESEWQTEVAEAIGDVLGILSLED